MFFKCGELFFSTKNLKVADQRERHATHKPHKILEKKTYRKWYYVAKERDQNVGQKKDTIITQRICHVVAHMHLTVQRVEETSWTQGCLLDSTAVVLLLYNFLFLKIYAWMD